MKTLYIDQTKFFQLKEKFDVTDENGSVVYQVQASLFKIPKQFFIYDPAGQEVGRVVNKPINLLPKLDIEVKGQVLATLSKKLSFIKAKYEVEGAGLSVKGNILDLSFELSRNGKMIGRVDKKWASIRDRYRLEVDDLSPEDEIIMLGTILGINFVKDRDGNGSNS